MPTSAAILVLNFNGKSHLKSCFESILRETRPQDSVYLVDNGSSDGSAEYVRENFPRVRLIRFDRNLGFAEAYNRASTLVNDDLLVFVNNDVEVGKNWLGALLQPFSDESKAPAVTGSKILFYHDRGLVNHGGGRLVPVGGGIDVDFLERDKGRPSKPQFAGRVSGASMSVRSSVFRELGGFDSDFFAYFEDVDFCWRAWLSGYQVIVTPESRLFHKFSATMGPLLNSKRVFLGERNRIQCMLKNLESRNIVLGLFTSFAYTFLRIFDFLRSHRYRPLLAALSGNWWNLTNLRRTIAKRRLVQRHRKIPDRFLFEHGLMISYIDGLVEFIRLASLREKYYDLFHPGRPGRPENLLAKKTR